MKKKIDKDVCVNCGHTRIEHNIGDKLCGVTSCACGGFRLDKGRKKPIDQIAEMFKALGCTVKDNGSNILMVDIDPLFKKIAAKKKKEGKKNGK